MNDIDFTAEGYRAKVAYEAYAKSTGGKTFDGRDMPRWADLGRKIQNAWIAASSAAVSAYRYSEDKE